MTALRFIVIDDHELVREGIVHRLTLSFPGSQVVHSGAVLADGVSAALANGCDCAVVDLDLGLDMTVAEVVSAFTVQDIPVLVVSALASAAALNSALAAGASGYVAKISASTDLEKAVRAVLAGKSWLGQDLAEVLADRVASVQLSAQEERALTLYASGLTLDMVARRMSIASSTAKHYIDRVREKCEREGIPARTKVQLNSFARSEGLI